ncbi:MAG: hypothetical protein Q8M01_13520 [Rubrivivax sp.]|nr:hypothetical protein [Rubrivivax sp.]
MPPATEHRGQPRRAACTPGAMYSCVDSKGAAFAALLQGTGAGARRPA